MAASIVCPQNSLKDPPAPIRAPKSRPGRDGLTAVSSSCIDQVLPADTCGENMTLEPPKDYDWGADKLGLRSMRADPLFVGIDVGALGRYALRRPSVDGGVRD